MRFPHWSWSKVPFVILSEDNISIWKLQRLLTKPSKSNPICDTEDTISVWKTFDKTFKNNLIQMWHINGIRPRDMNRSVILSSKDTISLCNRQRLLTKPLRKHRQFLWDGKVFLSSFFKSRTLKGPLQKRSIFLHLSEEEMWYYQLKDKHKQNDKNPDTCTSFETFDKNDEKHDLTNWYKMMTK